MTAMWLISLFAIVLSFAPISVADDLFIFPTAPGPNGNFVADLPWSIGSIQKIQWSTTADSYNITLWQQSMDESSGLQLASIYSIDSGGAGQQSFNWQVQTYNSMLSDSPVYFLWLTSDTTVNFTSHYFNITSRAQTSSSSSSSTSSTSSASLTTSGIASSISSAPPQRSSVTTATSSTATSSTATSPTPTSPTSASPSNETIEVGLGVGLGIGIPLVLIAGMWIGLKVVKQRRSSSIGTTSDMPLAQFPDNKYTPNSYPPPNESTDYANGIHEAPGRSPKLIEVFGEREPVELGSRES